jgi:hypothetical protein
MASDDVAAAMADATLAAPVNGTIEIAGPQRVGMASWCSAICAPSEMRERSSPIRRQATSAPN